ncbi:MAG: DNA/RNA nuclease SfsA, partial [Candidatus Ranarchaeia archaeon]
CTLSIANVALFPDAPTDRGKRHLETLIHLLDEGYKAGLMVLIFKPEATCFRPNMETDPKFSSTFWEAVKAGVTVHPLVFRFTGKTIFFEKVIPLCSVKGYG